MTANDIIANPELEGTEVSGVTRSSFILRGALAAGAVYGTTMVGPFVSQALAETGGGDAEILNFALTLEYWSPRSTTKRARKFLSPERPRATPRCSENRRQSTWPR